MTVPTIEAPTPSRMSCSLTTRFETSDLRDQGDRDHRSPANAIHAASIVFTGRRTRQDCGANPSAVLKVPQTNLVRANRRFAAEPPKPCGS